MRCTNSIVVVLVQVRHVLHEVKSVLTREKPVDFIDRCMALRNRPIQYSC